MNVFSPKSIGNFKSIVFNDKSVVDCVIRNPKLQAPNSKQITNHKSQIPNKNVLFVTLVIGYCDLSLKKRGTSFVIWCLGFGIFSQINTIIQ
jgi:hypothetical protein